MKMTLISKIIILNLSVLLISLITLFMVYDFVYEKNKNISLHRNYVNQFDKEIVLVASNLYRSAQMGDDSYLTQAAVSSKKVIYILKFFELHNMETTKLKEDYIDFFKNAVIASSLSLERRKAEAQEADALSLQKYELLQKEINILLHTIDKSEIDLKHDIVLIGSLFSVVFIFLILGNITYIIKSYKHIQETEQRAAQQKHDSMIQRATMMDAIGDGVYGVDKDGMCTFVNQSAINLLGFSKDEILKTHQHDLFHHHRKADNSLYPREECPISVTIQDRKTRELEEDFIKKDGTFFPVNLTVAPTSDGGAIVVFRDIAEKNMILASLKEAKERAEFTSKAKSQFLANMSHEIRTPMNAVIGLSELLFDTNLDEKQHDLLLKINSSSKILLGIINDILDYSKIEAGMLKLEHREFQLEDVLREVESIFSQSAAAKSIYLECNIEKETPAVVIGDELRLTQVLSNLISNAIKFTHSGSVKLDIKLSKKVDENRAIVLFSIKDTGIGMSKKALKDLFAPFTQADSSITRKYGGTGLGLSISKRIIEAMGAAIIVESQEQEGTTFSFELELEVVSWQKVEHSLVAKKEELQKFENLKILLAEDNLINQEVASMILKRVNIEVDVANNGKEAVEKYLANPSAYDMILMDLQMPVMSGYEATKLIRTQNTKIPIIALTAAAMIEDRQKAIDAGMNEHLGKPIDINELYKTISKFGVMKKTGC